MRKKPGLCVLLACAMLISSVGAASRPHLPMSTFINSPLRASEALAPLFQGGRSRSTAMSAAVGVDAADVLGLMIQVPWKLMCKLGAILGALFPEKLPSWWMVPEAGEHILGAGSILLSNAFYFHYAVKQFRQRRPLLGVLLVVAAGASCFYHGFQVLHGVAAITTQRACLIDTSIALTSGLVYTWKCGLPKPHLCLAACGSFFLAPFCPPLYAVSHSAWHFFSAYTAYAMAEGAATRSASQALLRLQAEAPSSLQTAQRGGASSVTVTLGLPRRAPAQSPQPARWAAVAGACRNSTSGSHDGVGAGSAQWPGASSSAAAQAEAKAPKARAAVRRRAAASSAQLTSMAAVTATSPARSSLFAALQKRVSARFAEQGQSRLLGGAPASASAAHGGSPSAAHASSRFAALSSALPCLVASLVGSVLGAGHALLGWALGRGAAQGEGPKPAESAATDTGERGVALWDWAGLGWGAARGAVGAATGALSSLWLSLGSDLHKRASGVFGALSKGHLAHLVIWSQARPGKFRSSSSAFSRV